MPFSCVQNEDRPEKIGIINQYFSSNVNASTFSFKYRCRSFQLFSLMTYTNHLDNEKNVTTSCSLQSLYDM
jgi:hypothetical protein